MTENIWREHNWYDESGIVPPGTPFPKIKSIYEDWHKEREKGYYDTEGKKVEKGDKGVYEIYEQDVFRGVKPHPQTGNLEFYNLFQPALQKLFPINGLTDLIFGSGGIGKFLKLKLPKIKRKRSSILTEQSLVGYIITYYVILFDTLTKYEKDAYEFFAKKGKKKGKIKVVSSRNLFTTRGVFSDGCHAFAVLHAFSVLCGIIKFGEILRTAPNPGGNPVPCNDLTLWIGIPKDVIENQNADALFDIGVKLMAWWEDPAFRSGSLSKSRLFLFFRIGMDFAVPKKMRHICATNKARQLFVTLEAPTPGCFEFDILKKGYWLYREPIENLFSKYTSPVLKFSIQSMSASQHKPDEPVVIGQYSYLPQVKAALRKHTKPNIDIELGGEW